MDNEYTQLPSAEAVAASAYWSFLFLGFDLLQFLEPLHTSFN